MIHSGNPTQFKIRRGANQHTQSTANTQQHIPHSSAAEALPTAPKDDRSGVRSGSVTETAAHAHEGSENARTALSGGVGGVPADPIAAATREAQEEENGIVSFLLGFSSSSCHWVSRHTTHTPRESTHTPRESGSRALAAFVGMSGGLHDGAAPLRSSLGAVGDASAAEPSGMCCCVLPVACVC